MYNEDCNCRAIGEFRNIIRHDDGRVVVTPWQRNTIVDDLGILVACLIKGAAGYSSLGYWVIGSGLDAWDANLPSPAISDHGVVTEIGRKQIMASNVSFLDGSNNITTSVTNKILIDVAFGSSECNGKWREFSIMGGNATSAPGTGIAINHKTHALITKDSSMVIERQIRFTFRQ